ncbi:protein EARLY FLOWERING 3 [Dorcoceras hygrometricum]|uniref:Protein EARLY FLOWERING 3 n=1 Tax=Dorcoceras hygrometricum TaxID=472368 RepID=A0A2Z7BZ36_9LAMI|nr:protein EARLY FLOWERING 3 [Dorcoceras hygrometricum]
MERGKDEGKMMGPMFPRLHVNDTDKGGPRAPPRNKMALYEQLSIPSQRFSHTLLPHNRNCITPNSVPFSSQGSGIEWGVFSSRQQPPRLIFEKQNSQYSDLNSPLTETEPRKKLDEDEFAVPIFTNSRPSPVDDREKGTPFSPSYFNNSSKFSKAAKSDVIEHLPRQEGQFHKERYSQGSVVGQHKFVKAISNSSIVEKTGEQQTYTSSNHEARSGHSNRINSPELAESKPATGIYRAVSRELKSSLSKSKCSISSNAFRSEDQTIVHDAANDGESREADRSCGPLQTGNMERKESVSEALVVDAVIGLDITPDDVVGILGQRQFWKARRTITNQQRVFAYQIFELHRLIKVQKGMSLSPHLLQDVASSHKPVEPAVPPRIIPSNVALVNVFKGESGKPSHKNEVQVQKSVGEPSLPAAQTGGNSQAPSFSSKYTPTGYQTQPHGHQWLIPLMSPSEGLVYKPYPGNSLVSLVHGGYINPVSGSFSTPIFGIPFQLPTFPSPAPECYFPPYCMPIMTAAFSGSSVEQTDVPLCRQINITYPRNECSHPT